VLSNAIALGWHIFAACAKALYSCFIFCKPTAPSSYESACSEGSAGPLVCSLDHFVSLPSLLCMVTCSCLSRHVEAHDHVSCQINVYYRSFVIRVIELIDLMSLYKCQAKTGKLRNPLLQAHRSRSPALAKPHRHAGQHGPQRSRRSLSSATALAYSTLQRLTYSLYRKSTWPPSIVKEHRNIIATAAGMIPGAGPSGALAVAAPNASSPKRAS